MDQSIRDLFPLYDKSNKEDIIYFDNASTSLKPKALTDALACCYQSYFANYTRGSYDLSEDTSQQFFECQGYFLRTYCVNSSDYSVIFTSGCTESINMIAQSYLNLKSNKGKRILISDLEHHSNYLPWKMIARELEMQIITIPLDNNFEYNLTQLKQMDLSDVVFAALTHVSNVLGNCQPISEVIEYLHKNDVIVSIDGAQYAPHSILNICDSNPDFYMFSAHKMLGPNGTGVIFLKTELLENMRPYRYGGGMVQNSIDLLWKSGVDKFYAGTPNIPNAIAWREMLRLLNDISFKRIMEYMNRITLRLVNELKSMNRICLLSENFNNNRGIISYIIEGIHPHDAAAWYNKHSICLRVGHHCAQPLMEKLRINSCIRASLYLYNTEDELDRFVQCTKQLIRLL